MLAMYVSNATYVSKTIHSAEGYWHNFVLQKPKHDDHISSNSESTVANEVPKIPQSRNLKVY